MQRNKVFAIISVICTSTAAFGGTINIPNFSFEMPPVERNEENPFGALPFLDDWDETAIGLADEFDQNTGVFLNTDMMSADYITNSHLDRMAFLSSLTGNGVRQAVADTYLVGVSYSLTVAVGKSFTFPVGNTEPLQIALFYFDSGVEQVIASTTINGSQVGTTTLSDFSVSIPAVQVSDAWAGEPIGVLIRPSPTDPDESGGTGGEGFWNVDFVRLDTNPSVPAASTWGLIVLGLLVLTVGTVLLQRRREQWSIA